MRKSVLFIAAAMILAFAFTACNQTEQTSTVKFGLELRDDSGLKSVSTDEDVVEALVSVRGANGILVFDKEPVSVYKFGDAYVTQSLRIPVGDFELTEFLLLGSTGEIHWATPLEGSSLAHLVGDPLPIPFSVDYEQTTNLDVQVVYVGDHSPGDFGYVSFGIGFVDRFCLQVQYNSTCPDTWNDTLAMGVPIFAPMMEVYVGNRYLFNQFLVAGLNQINLPMVNEEYTFVVSDCWNSAAYSRTFTLDELLEHSCGDTFPPLSIDPFIDPDILITPEEIKEPTIEQGVFGGVQLPYDGVVNTSRTDIFPVVTDIWFYPMAAIDSIYPMGMPESPVASALSPFYPTVIVRTNSNGIFQVPLDAGNYYYMTQNAQWYGPGWTAASPAFGEIMVRPGEVSELWIDLTYYYLED
ncbi:MAG: hypothetical protein R2751_14375 [Bacteroidales bacterium]